MRSSASHPADTHGRLAQNGKLCPPLFGSGRGRHNLHNGFPDRCDNSTACRLCRLEPTTDAHYLTDEHYLTNEHSLTDEHSLTNAHSLTDEHSLTNEHYLTNEYYLTYKHYLTDKHYNYLHIICSAVSYKAIASIKS